MALPNWPALMDETIAAAYLGVGTTSFRVLAVRNGLRPVELGLRLCRWRKSDLDGFVERLATQGEAPGQPSEHEVVVEAQRRALQLVESSSRRGRRG